VFAANQHPQAGRIPSFEHMCSLAASFLRVFIKYSRAFVVLPGGFGTLVETGKITRFPIVRVGRSYRSGLVTWIREKVLVEGKISPKDLIR
jgi:predicted Rossmann-fold nucleotide-binding protein